MVLVINTLVEGDERNTRVMTVPLREIGIDLKVFHRRQPATSNNGCAYLTQFAPYWVSGKRKGRSAGCGRYMKGGRDLSPAGRVRDKLKRQSGGEGGIRTPDRGVSPYNGLANRRLQPLGHLSDT